MVGGNPVGMFAKFIGNIISNEDTRLRKDTMSKANAIISAKDKDGNRLYPNADHDLLRHFFMSENLRYEKKLPFGLEISLGAGPSLILGLGKEVADGFGLFGNTGAASGFSVDDLGANWAGATDMTFDEAYKKGLFKHTEAKGWKGYGQGEYKKVYKKLIK
tara:strand:- start:60 stop:542 length:483 start_codon:yes stop_codon:yes gene_type:complete